LVLDDTDLDALELTAKQVRLVNARPTALRCLIRMEAAAQEQQMPIRRARALRLHSEFIADHSTKPAARNDARIKLETALDILSTGADTTEKVLEQALTNEQMARLHLLRGTFTRVERYLDEAHALYGRLPPPEGPISPGDGAPPRGPIPPEGAGRARIAALRTDLTRLQRGGDDPDEAPTSGT
jgi:hypothetical protein